MRTVPLIGGPKDGGVINIHDGDDVHAFSYYEQFVPPIMGEHRYLRQIIAGEKEKFHIFVSESLSADEALKRLVKGYRRGGTRP